MSPVAEDAGAVGPGRVDSADSHGVPWAGRNLTAQPFAGDDGTADAALITALESWSSGEGPLAGVVAAWAPTRVFVPIVAVLGEGDDVRSAAAAGQGDKSADMALVTLTGSDGRKLLPAFTSTTALASWNASARPVPVEAARAAQAAVVEECEGILIDPAGPVTGRLPRPAVWAVAQGRDWRPPAEDLDLLAGIAALVRAVPGVQAHRCLPDGDSGLVVVLGLPPGLDPAAVHEITGRMAQLLAADPVVTERTDSLRLSLRPA